MTVKPRKQKQPLSQNRKERNNGNKKKVSGNNFLYRLYQSDTSG